MLPSLHEILEMYHIPDFGVIPVPKKEAWLSCRAASRVPMGAKTLIVCIFPYNIGNISRNISRYALMHDYHLLIGALLEQACQHLEKEFGGSFVPFIDNSPFPEKSSAAHAGLGVIGSHSLLITPIYGSYVFIGEIVTDISFPAAKKSVRPCLQCGECQKACPTSALSHKGIDCSRCISGLTQKKGDLTEIEKQYIQKGGSVWGCDICQECCPMNKNARLTPLDAFYCNIYPILETHRIPADRKKRAYGYRGRKVIERNISILHNKTYRHL